jgi:acetylornithine deacetylase/succinyl-diaminopimelate desuccinylase-like protein
METQDLRQRVSAHMPSTIADLERLVRIPSLGYPGYDPANVRASAETVRDILVSSGMKNARLLELEGGHPAVFGQIDGPASSPTVLLYAHHDVQPEGPLDEWKSPPFEPDIRDGRMFGRGTADDKCGVVAHAAAIAAWEANPPVTVKVIIEGEEECTTEHLPQLVGGNADLLRAEVAVIADSGNYRRGVPTITTSIRGITDCVVEVKVLPQAQHSGSFGGPVPDAYTALARIISKLHDDRGNVAIDGLKRGQWEGLQQTDQEFRDESGILDGIELIGSGSISDRLWAGPAVSVLGIDGPRIHGSSNQIVPSARARVSLRVAPGDDPVAAREKLVDHLEASAPWGVQVTIDTDGGFEAGHGYVVDTSSPALVAAREALKEAWGTDTIEAGSGGSIPLVPILAETFPGIQVLMWGASDELSYYHSTNESVDLSELEKLCLAEALFLRNLGDR